MNNTTGTPELATVVALQSYVQTQRKNETIFLWLQVTGGQILLPVLLLTIVFSRNVHRNLVFVNFCCSWFLSSIVYSLLLYRGRSDPDSLSLTPSKQLCLAQASLVNGVQPLTACTTLGIVIQLLSSLYSVKKGTVADSSKGRRLLTLVLLIFPYFVFLVFTIVSAVLGSPEALTSLGTPRPNTNLAVPGVFYCTILLNSSSFSGAKSLASSPVLLSFQLLILSLCLEAFIVVFILKNLKTLRKKLPTAWTQVLIRIVVLSVHRFVLIYLLYNSPLVKSASSSPNELYESFVNTMYVGNFSDFMQATAPIVVFLVFASEKDVLNAWCFWRRKSNSTPTVSKESFVEAEASGTP
ncbi:hypothetical protein SCHPADRAFT_929385 [Schizopora paradoxa]|uniref:Fungal pheromone STE3G-protein-coupled receptor n=1 Tax=Schizopora paradoxa TaxID=27342 RepID=A0A0H2RJM3_9AGAM|nr:hypothetical protein SCHPADRAFT_929385 [Schizopora paradoxa]